MPAVGRGAGARLRRRLWEFVAGPRHPDPHRSLRHHRPRYCRPLCWSARVISRCAVGLARKPPPRCSTVSRARCSPPGTTRISRAPPRSTRSATNRRWGRHRGRTRPTPGNHEYETAGASGYFGYFGANAGPSGQGYYSYDIGAWHIVSLNSNAPASEGSPQMQWLRDDLASTRARCVAAIWHHPLFSSGQNGGYSPDARCVAHAARARRRRRHRRTRSHLRAVHAAGREVAA